MMARWPALLTLTFVCACGGEPQESSAPQVPPSADAASPSPADPSSASQAGSAAEADHGEHRDLGTLELGEFALEVAALGEVKAGAEAAFEVDVARKPDGTDAGSLNLFLWLEDATGSQVSAPAKGDVEEGRWHFHVTPRDGSEPSRVVLRLRHAGSDERAGLPLSGHGHEHAASVHGGVPAAFHDSDGAVAGHLELKLHDDKGDLELWLAHDAQMSQPFDLPLEATLVVKFIDVDDREAVLRVRNTEQNEDEDGTPSIRQGRTNYFIYPGESGEDSSWLQGAEFSSIVQVTLLEGGASYQSEEFVLVPHTHGETDHQH